MIDGVIHHRKGELIIGDSLDRAVLGRHIRILQGVILVGHEGRLLHHLPVVLLVHQRLRDVLVAIRRRIQLYRDAQGVTRLHGEFVKLRIRERRHRNTVLGGGGVTQRTAPDLRVVKDDAHRRTAGRSILCEEAGLHPHHLLYRSDSACGNGHGTVVRDVVV